MAIIEHNGREYEVYTDSFWITRHEMFTAESNGVQLSRKTSAGLAIKSSDKAPSIVLYDQADKALNLILDQEYERWLNQIKAEQSHRIMVKEEPGHGETPGEGPAGPETSGVETDSGQ